MGKKYKPLIHIGYHKTGTTWLQNNLFEKNNLVNFCSPFSRSDIISHLVTIDQFRFNSIKTKDFFQSGIKETIPKNLIPVISHERLSGKPYETWLESKVIADRIVEIFPEAFILIVIREQQAAILSMYIQYVRNGGSASLEQFLAIPPLNSGFRSILNYDHFEYNYLISYYHKLFGCQNVLILPYEWMRLDLNNFCQQIIRFAKAESSDDAEWTSSKENVAWSSLTVKFKRYINLIAPRDMYNPDNSWHYKLAMRAAYIFDRFVPKWLEPKSNLRMKNFIQSKIGNYYHESNCQTSRLIGIDLSELNYE